MHIQMAHGGLVLAVAIASLQVLASGSVGLAQSASDGSDGSAAQPIPLTSLGDLTSLDASVTLNADGSMDGRPMAGDLTIELTSNDQHESRIDITGSLLGPVAAQVGGKLVGLFRPRAVSVYTVEDGTYVVVSGLTDVCVKPSDNAATDALAQFSPQSLLALLTGSDVARGTLVGEEVLDGQSVDHWAIDGEAFLAAARESSDPTVRTFGESLRGASKADLFVSSESGYPLRYQGGFDGAYEPLGLDGDFSVQIDLTGVDTNTSVTLPGACDHPISR